MKEKLSYEFQIKVFGSWVNPIEGRFYEMRHCWKFSIRNKKKYENYKQRIVSFNSKNIPGFIISITLSNLCFYEEHLKMLEELS